MLIFSIKNGYYNLIGGYMLRLYYGQAKEVFLRLESRWRHK